MTALNNLTLLVLAGGSADRMGNICSSVPKPMLNFLRKPFLQWLVEWYINQSIGRIIISVSDANADRFQVFFETPYWYNRGVRILVESGRLGTGGAVANFVHSDVDSNDDVLLCNGDTILDYNPNEAYGFFLQNRQSPLALLTIDEKAPNKGAVKVSGGNIVSFREDGSNRYTCLQDQDNYLASSVGHYFFSRDNMCDFLTQGKQSLEQETIPYLIEVMRVRAMLASENFFYDYGTHERYKWLKKNEKIVKAIYGLRK